MATNHRSLVVIQLSGGNDYMNTVVPYGNGLILRLAPLGEDRAGRRARPG